MKKILMLIGIAAMAAGGCGYHRARLDNPLTAGYKTIAIPYFKNKTFEPGAEKYFTDAFMQEFIKSRKLAIAGEDQADLILYGTVRNLKEESVAQNSNDKTLEYLLYMTVDLQLEERTTGKVLWKRKGMRHVEDYPIYIDDGKDRDGSGSRYSRRGKYTGGHDDYTGDDIPLSEAAKRQALEKIAAELAERSHESIMIGF